MKLFNTLLQTKKNFSIKKKNYLEATSVVGVGRGANDHGRLHYR